MPKPKAPAPRFGSAKKRRPEGFRLKAHFAFDAQKPSFLKGKRRLFEQVHAQETKLWREKGRLITSTRKPLNVRFVKMKFDFRKMADVKRYLGIKAKNTYVPDLARADAKNLLKALPGSRTFMYKTFRVIQVPKRFWKWAGVDSRKTPAFSFMNQLVVVRQGIPEKYLNTILNHEVRETIMMNHPVEIKGAHRIAKKREKLEAPRGFYEWLRINYPEARSERRFGLARNPY